jgi:hypothetical protein
MFTAGIPKRDMAVFDRVIRKIIARLEDYTRAEGNAATASTTGPAGRSRMGSRECTDE